VDLCLEPAPFDVAQDTKAASHVCHAATVTLAATVVGSGFSRILGRSGLLHNPVDLGDVRVVRGRQRPRFALEARQPLRILREQVRQDLDGDLAPGSPARAKTGYVAGAAGRYEGPDPPPSG